VWRIRRENRSDHIELFKVEEVGHGSIITDEFMNWRIKLSLNKDKPPGVEPEVEPSEVEPSPAEEPTPEPASASGA
jgi:RAT1-interacting protein